MRHACVFAYFICIHTLHVHVHAGRKNVGKENGIFDHVFDGMLAYIPTPKYVMYIFYFHLTLFSS